MADGSTQSLERVAHSDRLSAQSDVVANLSVDAISDAATAIRTRGAPSQYKPDFVPLAHNLALLGHSDAQIADVLGVSSATICRWIAKKREFRSALARGRGEADGEVALGLFQRAKGYSREAVKVFMPPGASEPVYARYQEHVPPDPGAASFWLRNKQPDKWKEKTETNVSGSLTLEALVLASVPSEPRNITPAIGQAPPANDIDDLL